MKRLFIFGLFVVFSQLVFAREYSNYTVSIRIKNCTYNDDFYKISAGIGLLDFKESKGFVFNFQDAQIKRSGEKTILFQNNDYRVEGTTDVNRDYANFAYYVFLTGNPNYVKKASVQIQSCSSQN